MDEGVDPRQMCQSLINKVAQSEILKAVADPDILVLFEDWLEELEDEVVARVKESGSERAEDLARAAGISQAGAAFLLAKLKQEGKL